jgi:hypothetical protein
LGNHRGLAGTLKELEKARSSRNAGKELSSAASRKEIRVASRAIGIEVL